MTSFGLIRTGAHYQKRFNAFLAKTEERVKNFEILRSHLRPLIQRSLRLREKRSGFDILSVGSGTGEMDIEIMKIIKEELQKSGQGRSTKIFNRAIEPNEYSCGHYKAAIENLPSPMNDQLTEFEIRQQTFEEYIESEKESVRFDLVHFMHSIYYVDIEQAMIHCFEKELNDKGTFACIVEERDLSYWVTVKQGNQWHGKEKGSEVPGSEVYDTTDKMIKIAYDNGWKHEIYSQEYSVDVTEVFDEKSTEGNLLLDFLTHTVNFREKADKQLVEETLTLIKDLTTVKDGKRFGDKKESLLFIYK